MTKAVMHCVLLLLTGHRTLYIGVHVPLGRKTHRRHRHHGHRHRKRSRERDSGVEDGRESPSYSNLLSSPPFLSFLSRSGLYNYNTIHKRGYVFDFFFISHIAVSILCYCWMYFYFHFDALSYLTVFLWSSLSLFLLLALSLCFSLWFVHFVI